VGRAGSSPPIFRFGDFEADAGARELRRSGRPLPLPEKPFALLLALLERAGEPVSRPELCSRLWPDGTHVDFDNNLNSAVARLRAVMNDPASRSRWIETLPRRGYRFRAPVEIQVRRDAGIPRRARGWMSPAALSLAAFVAVLLSLTPLSPRRAEVPEAARVAHDRGLYLLRDPAPGSAGRAAGELERAVRLAPAWAPARGALAEALLHSTMASGEEMLEKLDRVETAALGALELDPAEPAAHRALSGVRLLRDWDVAGASALAERAVALAPQAAASHMTLAGARCAASRFGEAVAAARRAARLDPASWLVRSDLGFFLMAAGRVAEAEAEARAALELAPDFTPARRFLGAALAAQGREAEALRVLGADSAEGDAASALRRHWRGRLEALEALPASRPGVTLARARLHARLDEPEAALAWLDRARELHEPVLVYLEAFPELRSLHRDPRFETLRRRVFAGSERRTGTLVGAAPREPWSAADVAATGPST